MKAIVKMAAVAAMAMVSMQSNAQSVYDYAPQGGTFTTEVKFNPFSADFKTFGLSGLKGRYFMTDQDAIRLNVDFGIDNFTRTDKTTFDDTFRKEDEYTISNSEKEIFSNNMSLKIALGYERHFFSNGRLDVYAGVEGGYEAIFRSGEENETQNSEKKETYGSKTDYTITDKTSNTRTEYSGMNPNGEYNEHSFFANVFTGIDFYIYKGLYVGTEFGLRFSFGKTMKYGNYTTDFSGEEITQNWNNSTKTTSSVKTNWTSSSEAGTKIGTIQKKDATGTITETEIKDAMFVVDNYNNYTKFEVYIEPALRLGWRF